MHKAVFEESPTNSKIHILSTHSGGGDLPDKDM
jgi:hypothetical protein